MRSLSSFGIALFPALLAGPLACSSAGLGEELVGDAVASVTQVPAGVGCLRITVAGLTTVTRTFDVSPGQSTTLTLRGLPAGNDTFVADALPVSCGDAGATGASWASQPVNVAVSPGATANVNLVLEPVARGNVTVDFDVDAGGGSLPNTVSCNSSGCVCAPGFADCDGTLTNGCEANITSDANNCNACGVSCNGNACVNGRCALVETFSLTASNVITSFNDCGNGNLHATTGFSFRWQDTTPVNAVPTSIVVTFAQGIQCASPGTGLPTTLNGVSSGNYAVGATNCSCTGSATRTFTLQQAALAGYVIEGTNTLTFSSISDEGVLPLNGSTYATVVVTF